MQPIELKVKKDWLPVKLVDEESGETVDTLRFYYDDDTVKNFQKDSDKFLAKIEKISKENKSDTQIEDDILREFFNYWLGDEAYEKLKMAQKSIYHRKDMVIDLSLAISNALFIMKEQQEEKQAEFYAAD
ncbi:hypothetical protein JZO80_02945 [Vagococcus fluvialis]|uniref:hypothetical protein n=1 Tax=Vagococcus fluvialis TaxID=2738 RepID=UPI000A35AB7D|nr:hypothetical protein [Vagococcus fluvialis]MBO0419106.1 hypothetical protein [Vagococcus fluvialis]OTP29531.1 hypothetical protein A5798_002699 [Enterococcus sp. 6C8_DIV0013]